MGRGASLCGSGLWVVFRESWCGSCWTKWCVYFPLPLNATFSSFAKSHLDRNNQTNLENVTFFAPWEASRRPFLSLQNTRRFGDFVCGFGEIGHFCRFDWCKCRCLHFINNKVTGACAKTKNASQNIQDFVQKVQLYRWCNPYFCSVKTRRQVSLWIMICKDYYNPLLWVVRLINYVKCNNNKNRVKTYVNEKLSDTT